MKNLDDFLSNTLAEIDHKVSKGITRIDWETIDPTFSLSALIPFCVTPEIFFFESIDKSFSLLALGLSKKLTKSESYQHCQNYPSDYLVTTMDFENDESTYLAEWVFIKNNHTLSLNIYKSLEFDSYSPSNLLFNQNVWESFLGPWTSYEESPESDEWELMISSALRLFQKNILKKIVLSRSKIYSYDEKIDHGVLFKTLYDANLDSQHFNLFIQSDDQNAFISFTPERLYTRKNRQIETVSLAGSTKRGENISLDKNYETELMTSEKLINEHQIVTIDISEKLKDITEELLISPLETLKLPYIQHRQSKIFAVLKENISDFDLISALHPTAAVGGLPSAIAKNEILKIEKKPRFKYAAPAGIISKDFAEIIVGIRSAQIDNQKLILFGGAGIVPGSIASEEWIETGVKMKPFLSVINKGVLE